jgi:enterochelin esterase family protein
MKGRRIVPMLVLMSTLVRSNFGQQSEKSLVSPEVHVDRSVTFRFRSPNAKEVMLSREGARPAAMQKDDQGIWSVTIRALDPDIYGYSFVTDGVELIDPSNPRIIPNLLGSQSAVHVPGPASLPWEVNAVPHGTVHHHYYHSATVGDDRDFFVYTPPSYPRSGTEAFPVLYLLHGFSDDASGWTSVGQAHVILDNLIAQGKVKPMIVVMPLGYGAPEILDRSRGDFRNVPLRERNFEKFSEALINEVLPQVESNYRVSKDREARAIAGLSMGGAESLLTGLNHLNRFGWIGAFSSGGLGDEFSAAFPTIDAKGANQLTLFWLSCGAEDGLIKRNRVFHDWLQSKGIRHRWIETPGAHTWMVWRRNLAEFTSLLFKGKDPS